MQKRAMKEPGPKKRGTKQPGTKQLGTKQLGTKKPGTKKPGTKKPLSWRLGVAAIFTREKGFDNPWIGHATLNRCGLHPARIALADAITGVRRRALGARREASLRALERDGVLVLPNFLAPDHFVRVQEEVRQALERAERRRSVESVGDRGFGPQRPFAGGIDRWDGDTLNRFLFIDDSQPQTKAAATEAMKLAALAIGVRAAASRVQIYQTVHGSGDPSNFDIQKVLHRDTFHSALKFWLFLEDVELEHGPFVYVKGSHRMNLARYRWEYARAKKACRDKSGSSFRIHPDELGGLGYEPAAPVPVRANTLVLADVRGFHRRGDAAHGARRVALYANLRPNPFVPVPHPF